MNPKFRKILIIGVASALIVVATTFFIIKRKKKVGKTIFRRSAVKYAKGMGTEDRLNSLQYNIGPPIPLPEGQMFFFKDTKFSPSCCPSTYTSGIGCACMSKKQFQYLTERGGNHTIPNNRTSYFNEF